MKHAKVGHDISTRIDHPYVACAQHWDARHVQLMDYLVESSADHRVTGRHPEDLRRLDEPHRTKAVIPASP